MRFASVRTAAGASWGVVANGAVHPIDAATAEAFPTLKHAIAAAALKAVHDRHESWDAIPVDEVEWAPLIPEPGKILCVGLNYEKHREETARPVVAHPTIFTRFADSQTGHRQPIVRPIVSEKLDYEGELALVIGKRGRAIAARDALDHIAGFSCYNDGSVRDWQHHTMQFTPGKNFPGTGAFGPWLVTPDEFGDIPSKRIRTRLNGEVMQDAHFSELIFGLDRLIEYVSAFTPLEPGDVIVTGTPGGVGAKRKPPVFMKPGDHVEVEIEGIGVLRNGIADELAP
ncbi:fumarylacetoacetate hydrolase family protein [Sphingomonas sp. CGMCC 1.13654]|uniref:Fumarylacetoacetate hydrolase family protein n=1 Tax=Sphingomonas chungangi TaxID=2683589 RepID=A0A838L2S0_9SPHN|nr:fumarylacetoacetate hydrolase family protein [Sphingomonas chungangi]MBA2933484.1 fumarylacetoacetate hydrolase family protein [Sphingomonas chungangi]MVW54817.1 5-carboxymethyl-2-hydroxymuconate isomerase [Sphingomonas chungangi]